MTLDSSKTFGEIGAILMLIGPFSGVYTAILGLIGLILLAVAFFEIPMHSTQAPAMTSSYQDPIGEHGISQVEKRPHFFLCEETIRISV
jgi:hypothetical protein